MLPGCAMTQHFHHVVLFRLRAGIPLDQVRAAREALAELVETLPGVVEFTVTDNLSSSNQGFTMALFSTFENRQAYEIFSRHPEVQGVWDEQLEPVIESSLVAQGQ